MSRLVVVALSFEQFSYQIAFSKLEIGVAL